MKRNVSLAEISDGHLYKANDMVKADCGGCEGCSRCCHGMGNSIILDPYDVYRMTTGMGKSMQELLAESADCFLWEDIMRMGDFLIFSRPENVRRRIAAR